MSPQNRKENSSNGCARTPNAECVICKKPLYRRPSELAKVRVVACMEHRAIAQKNAGITDAQQRGLSLGRQKGTNHRDGYKHKVSSKQKASASHKAWCAEHPEAVAARGLKTRAELHHNWKGGSARLNSSIRRMTENRRWMDAVVRRDAQCATCGATVDLKAHHIKPLAEIVTANGITTREQARKCAALWDLTNGVTLCERCHCKYHGRAYTPTGGGRRKQSRKVRQPIAGAANQNYRGGKVALTCPKCGGMFYVKQAKVGIAKFCSRKCVNENQRKSI